MDTLLALIKIIWLLNAAIIGFALLCLLVIATFTWLTKMIVDGFERGDTDDTSR